MNWIGRQNKGNAGKQITLKPVMEISGKHKSNVVAELTRQNMSAQITENEVNKLEKAAVKNSKFQKLLTN